MSTMAINELEDIASQKANLAVQYDLANEREKAIVEYKNVIEILGKLCNLVEEDTLRRTYLGLIEKYKRRISELESQKEPIKVTIDDNNKISDIMRLEKKNISWEEVIGLEHAKRAIRSAIEYPDKRPDLYKLGPSKYVLLYGPSGCGKTYLAAAVATSINAEFYEIKNVFSHFLGESEKNITRIFNYARSRADNGAKVVLFFDEVDSIIGKNVLEVGGENRVRSQLSIEMDGLESKGKDSKIFVIAATNEPWNLDERFLRRFTKRIYVGPPEEQDREKILKLYVQKAGFRLSPDINFSYLAKITENYSADDLYNIVKDIENMLAEEVFQKTGGKGERRHVVMQDFFKVINSRAPSIDVNSIKKYEEWKQRFGSE
ncbi:MAG: ATP-binding protein [Thermoproteota archaeon]|nr:ATP-binding protein [Candidatus Brockarchaeota archaeon]